MGRIIMEGGNAMQIADQATKEGVSGFAAGRSEQSQGRGYQP